MDRKRFFGLPSLGGWLSMANAAMCYSLSFAASHGFYFEFPTGEYIGLMLSLPVSWMFIRPVGGCINPISNREQLAVMCFMMGVNSFVWGYGLAAIIGQINRCICRNPNSIDPLPQ